MHKNALLFIIIIFTAWQSHAQIDSFPGIKDVLKKGSFAAIDHYANELRQEVNCKRSEDRIRTSIDSYEITPNFSQGQIYISKCGEDLLYVDYLSKDTSIFYVRIISYAIAHSSEDEPQISSIYIDTINRMLYTELFKSFETVYGVPINTSELFLNGYFSIGGCGLGGGETSEYKKVSGFIETKNIPEIQKFLRSPDIPNQLYALYAFYQLKKEGYKPDDDTERIINYIKQKKSMVNECGGCLMMPFSITDIISHF